MHVKRKLGAALGALTLVVMGIGFVAMPAAATPAGHPLPAGVCTDDKVVVDHKAYDEKVVDVQGHNVHHDAVTHIVHHDAVAGKWSNFEPNKDQGTFEGPPTWPTDARGTWSAEKTNGGPQQDAVGVYQNGNGNGSWFHRGAGTPASDEVVVDHKAYDEWVPTTYKYIHHDAVTHTVPGTCDVWVTWKTDTWKPNANDASDVAWPQHFVSFGQVAPTECEVTYQQDRYQGSKADIEAVLADSLLTDTPVKYEDKDIVKEWKFVSSDKCVVIPQDANANIVVSQANCTETGLPTGISGANASLDGGLEGLDKSVGTHEAHFTAVAGHLFSNGTNKLTVSYTIDPVRDPNAVECRPDKPKDGYGKEYKHDAPVCVDPRDGTSTVTTEVRHWHSTFSWDNETHTWVEDVQYGDWEVKKVSDPAWDENCAPAVASVSFTQENTCADLDGSGFLTVVGAHLVSATVGGAPYSGDLADFHDGAYDATAEGDYVLTYAANPGFAFPEGEGVLTFTVTHKTAGACATPVPAQFNVEPNPASCFAAGTFDIDAEGTDVGYGVTRYVFENVTVDVDRSVAGKVYIRATVTTEGAQFGDLGPNWAIQDEGRTIADRVVDLDPQLDDPEACPTADLPATLALPVVVDVCGVDDDSVTLPANTEGVTYRYEDETDINNWNIEAIVDAGYVVTDVPDGWVEIDTGAFRYEVTHTDVPCDTTVVPPPVEPPALSETGFDGMGGLYGSIALLLGGATLLVTRRLTNR